MKKFLFYFRFGANTVFVVCFLFCVLSCDRILLSIHEFPFVQIPNGKRKSFLLPRRVFGSILMPEMKRTKKKWEISNRVILVNGNRAHCTVYLTLARRKWLAWSFILNCVKLINFDNSQMVSIINSKIIFRRIFQREQCASLWNW